MNVSIVDGLIAAVLLIGVIFGYRRGLVRQLLSLTGWIIAYMAAYLLCDFFAPWVEKLLPFGAVESAGAGVASNGEGGSPSVASLFDASSYVGRAIAFALLFFGCKLLLSVVGWLLHGVASLPVLRTVNRTGGALLGFVETAVILVIALLVMDALPSERAQAWADQSAAFAWLQAQSPFLLDSVKSLWK